MAKPYTRVFAAVAAALLVIGAIVWLLYSLLSPVPEGAFRVGVFNYYPERIVLSEQRIGESAGTLTADLYFEPYLDPERYDAPASISAGTSYYRVLGLNTVNYLAVPYQDFFFLYSTDPNTRVTLDKLPTDTGRQALYESLAETQAQACFEAALNVSNYQSGYCMLSLSRCYIDKPQDLLRLIVATSDERGGMVLLPYLHQLEEHGYLDKSRYGMLISGHFVDIYNFSVGTEQRPQTEDGYERTEEGIIIIPFSTLPAAYQGEMSVEVGAGAGGLAGSGTFFVLELKEGKWAVRDSGMTWIA